jgi:hypothetical protein
MNEDKESFTNFVKDMYSKKKLYLDLLNSFDEYDYSNVMIKLTCLDSDTYDVDVFKWMVEIEPSDTCDNLFIYNYKLKDIYTLLDINENKKLVEDEWVGFNEYLINNGEFLNSYTEKEFNSKYEIKVEHVDLIEQWITSMKLNNAKLIFKPCEYN